MNYDTRLRRLEDKAPGDAQPDLIVHFVDPERGTVAALDVRAHTWHRRSQSETSQQLFERIAGHRAGTAPSVCGNNKLQATVMLALYQTRD